MILRRSEIDVSADTPRREPAGYRGSADWPSREVDGAMAMGLQIPICLVTLLIMLAALSALPVPAPAQSVQPTADALPGVPWPAVDALGRELPLAADVGPPRRDRFVGIFYFLWHDTLAAANPSGGGPYDVARILAADPHALDHPTSPLWGPVGTYHYWGEPLFGYYRSDDPWVIRRHARLLADAGIDTLIFDTTNAATYPETVRAVCDTFQAVRAEGGQTPQIAFMVNTQAGKTAEKLYDEIYRPGLYRDLWFRWEGKPLLLCDPAHASPDVRRFFTLRGAHWPFTMINTPYAWHWEATYPQPYGYTNDPRTPEQVNVSVAQNLRVSDGQVTNMSSGEARGRSFHGGAEDRAPGGVNLGLNFREQWERAIALDPPFVMVTGWNEWIAGRWGKPGGRPEFVDQFDEEYSRDIEPMRGGHGDNYYWQLVGNVRRYKGAPLLPRASAPKTVRIGGAFSQWADVAPEYVSPAPLTAPRNHRGAAGLEYHNATGRNAIVACKVARDARSVYFYVQTLRPISPHSDTNWMWLLIRTSEPSGARWEGYDYIVNRKVKSGRESWIEKCEGGWSWKRVARITYRVAGNELHIAIPRTALGLRADNTVLRIDFKWVDNASRPGDTMDTYVSGDVAPPARFRYRYIAD